MADRISPSLVDYLVDHNDLVLDLAYRINALEDQLQDVLKYLEPKYTAKEKGKTTWHLLNDEWMLANKIMKTLSKDYTRKEAKKRMRKFSLSIIEGEKEKQNADGV